MSRTLSTAEDRRAVVTASNVHVFARHGLRATTIADVAEHAGISPAYASKLFTSKERLFLAALEECFDRIVAALEAGAAAGTDPASTVSAMGEAYARPIADRDLLMLQVHALAATDHPAVAEELRSGVRRVVEVVTARSGAADDAVQEFVARGQLCHLLTALDLFDEPGSSWAATLTRGLTHVPDAARREPRV